MVTSQGLCAKPGDRLVITDVKFERSRIVFDIDGGPDPRHRFLRHVELGSGGVSNPVLQGDNQEPVGARLSLTFKDHVPELTGAEVKALLAPLISFDVKTPVEAFTDTLPLKLKQAILDHHVLVGMSVDMVLFAMGQPDTKSREMDGQMPFEEWIYGKPPKPVEFVRINGNRVIRVEMAKVGEPPEILTKNEVDGLMRTDGTPVDPAPGTRVAKMGDIERDHDTQTTAPPPSLRKPGESLPADDDPSTRTGVMKPVRFPDQKPAGQADGANQAGTAKPAGSAPQPGQNPDAEPPVTPATVGPPLPDASQPGSGQRIRTSEASPAGFSARPAA
jgi:hypothetical protein